jgi:hypothetical protein
MYHRIHGGKKDAIICCIFVQCKIWVVGCNQISIALNEHNNKLAIPKMRKLLSKRARIWITMKTRLIEMRNAQRISRKKMIIQTSFYENYRIRTVNNAAFM